VGGRDFARAGIAARLGSCGFLAIIFK